MKVQKETLYCVGLLDIECTSIPALSSLLKYLLRDSTVSS